MEILRAENLCAHLQLLRTVRICQPQALPGLGDFVPGEASAAAFEGTEVRLLSRLFDQMLSNALLAHGSASAGSMLLSGCLRCWCHPRGPAEHVLSCT